jgi:hypothetical protein
MPIKKQPPASLLGIGFEDSHVHVARLRRSAGRVQVLASGSFDLSANPLSGDAAALGLELKQKLQELNLTEKRCVIALPLHWALTLQTQIPDLAGEDVDAFLQTEAERNLPYAPESLSISSNRCLFPGGGQFNTMAAVPLEKLEQLQTILKTAELRALSFTLGISSVQRPEDLADDAAFILSAGARSIELEISCRSGIAGLRPLQTAVETESSQIYADIIGRELRISLGQLPPALRESVRKVILVGERKTIDRLALELAPRAEAMGLAIEKAGHCSGPPNISPDDYEASPAICAASRFLLQQKPIFEFLPPRVSAWKQLATKTGPRKFAYIGGVAAGILLLVAIAFFIQHWQLSNVEARWSKMEPQVKDLDDMQQEIKRFRPWFDNSFRTLSILRKLTETFPVDGVVTAKTIEIRDMSQVVCTGTAHDNTSLFKMLDQLRDSKEVTELKMDSIRGNQFTFNFRWVEGGTGEH